MNREQLCDRALCQSSRAAQGMQLILQGIDNQKTQAGVSFETEQYAWIYFAFMRSPLTASQTEGLPELPTHHLADC